MVSAARLNITMAVKLALSAFLCLIASAYAQEYAQQPVDFEIPNHWRSGAITDPVFGGSLFVADTGDIANPAVLLVHGLGAAGLSDWRLLVPALEKDFHVILLDLPGFGRSSAPPGQYSPTNYARVLREVKQRYHAKPIYVIGHSMGGAVSLRYTALYPDDVKQLVLVNAAGILERTAFMKNNAHAFIQGNALPIAIGGTKSLAQGISDRLFGVLGGLYDPTQTIGNNEFVWGRIFSGSSNMNAGMALVAEDFTQAVLSLQPPVRLIWGDRDPIAPLRTGKLLAAQLPDADLQVIRGAEHMPMFTHTSDFNRLILSTLGSSPAKDLSTKSQGPEQDIYRCKDKSDLTITGTFYQIILDNCHNVTLDRVQTNQINARNSSATIEHTTINAPTIGLLSTQSTLTATNLTITGSNAIFADGGVLDLAGTRIDVSGEGVRTRSKTSLIFSISTLRSRHYRGNLHGAYRLEQSVLEKSLRN